jgi:parvulin-like peptidyl-prolyl isomerase
MTKLAVLCAVIAAVIVAMGGCGTSDEKVIIRLTDNAGELEPRVVKVGYVNERLDRLPPLLHPDVGGDEGKLEFLEEVAQKELLVMAALRLGLANDPLMEEALTFYENKRALELLREELFIKPGEVSQRELEEHYANRDSEFTLQEIAVGSLEEAEEVYRRVTEGGESFADVAREVSTAGSAKDGGRKGPMLWPNLHWSVSTSLRGLQAGDIAKPVRIGNTYFIHKVAARKDPETQKPLEGAHLRAIMSEARAIKQGMLERETWSQWLDSAEITYNDEGIRIAGARIDEKSQEVFPVPEGREMNRDERRERAVAKVVPEFTEEEAGIEFTSFKIGDTEHTWTLGDLQGMLDGMSGPETLKNGEPPYIETLVRRLVSDMLREYHIDEGGYRTSPAMRQYLDDRREETLVDLVYVKEVREKSEAPMGDEIKAYYHERLDEFRSPERADVQQILVGTEAEANRLIQMLREGKRTFEELVEEHSIDDWSKTRGGKIEDFRKDQLTFSHLNEPAFSLDLGEISDPVAAPGGFAIVRVLARYPEEQLSFEEVGDRIVDKLTSRRLEERLKAFLDEVRETVTVDIDRENLKYMNDPAEVLAKKEQMKREGTWGG